MTAVIMSWGSVVRNLMQNIWEKISWIKEHHDLVERQNRRLDDLEQDREREAIQINEMQLELVRRGGEHVN